MLRYRIPLNVRSIFRFYHRPINPTQTRVFPSKVLSHPNLVLTIAHAKHTMSPSKEEKKAATEKGNNRKDLEGELNEWKFRAPYKIHDENEGFNALYEASCHCGRVNYQLSREKPLVAKYCHCTTCQRLHGAPFQWAAVFHKEDINFTKGHHDLGWYDSSEKTTRHKLPCKVSCAYCRTPIMDEGRNMILLFPTLIKFKNNAEKKNFDATCHMFYSQRVVDIKDGKPKWSGLSDESDLIEDSPPEAIKKRKRDIMEEENEKGIS